jgi:MFS family permease
MKNRIKWLLVGLGITFGLQVLISLIFTGIAFSAARSESGTQEESISVLILGFTIGSFLVGGFVIGWLEESIRVTDGLIVAVATLILSALIYISLPQGNKGQFVTGIYLGGGADQFLLTGRGAIFAALALVAAAAGSYLGGRVSAPQESALDRVAVLLGLIGAIVGPFVLLAVGGNESASNQPNLPWYFLVIVLVVLLLIVAAGFVMFTRESHYEEEISISPDRRLEH